MPFTQVRWAASSASGGLAAPMQAPGTLGGMFHWSSRLEQTHDRPGVTLGFTDRSPGLGEPPYTGLNLGGHVGDEPERVETCRAALAGTLGIERPELMFLDQVHGATVVQADRPWPGTAPKADAVVTTAMGLALAVLVADCVPVLVHDQAAGVVGAAHAGRPGLFAGVVPALVEAMRDLGAQRPHAVIGPSVCARCYEVPQDLHDAAARAVPSSAGRSWTGTPAIDVAAGVAEQLAVLDVPMTWVPGCTRESPSLYSYRRDGVTGRFAGVVVMTRGTPS